MLRRMPTCLIVVVLGVFTLSPALAGPEKTDYTGHQLIEVTLNTPADVQTMLAISEDHWSEGIGVGTFPFRIPPDRLDDLANSGLAYTVLNTNIQEMIDNERAGVGPRDSWFDDYKTLPQINSYIDDLVALRPDLVTKLTIGTSLEGRTVYGMKIASSVGGDSKPAVLFDGTQHAREWISPMTVMYIADQLVRQYDIDPQIQQMVDDVTFYIIPVVNADGYVYTYTSTRLWRKNRRNNGDGTFGVDLNRNWGYGWGGSGSSGSGSSETYRGTAPFSEPETQYMRDFMIAHADVIGYIDFHSYSQLILYPWGYQFSSPDDPDYTTFVNLSAGMAAAIFGVHGKDYTDQASWELYLADGVAPDYAYGQLGILGWTIELRDTGTYGFVLPAAQIIPTGEENFEAIKVLVDHVATIGPLTITTEVPSTVEPGVAMPIDVTVTERFDTVQTGTETIYTRIGTSGAFTASSLTDLGGGAYEGTLPAAPCGETIEYYVEVQTTGGTTITDPADAPASLYDTDVVEVSVAFEDDMEAANGWTVGDASDTANTGVWVRVDPVGTAAQPEDDHTAAGTMCWVTGQGTVGGSVGANDVDGGTTTLFTPTIDLSTMNDPTISYWRWYSNDQGSAPNDDVFTVDINDGGGWVNVETVGPSGTGTTGGWFYHELRVLDYVSLTGAVQLRFIADDSGNGSIVEAAVDDLLIADLGCSETPCVGDLDGSNSVDLTDLGVLLGDYGCTGAGCVGDLNGDNSVDLTDLGLLLGAYGQPCP